VLLKKIFNVTINEQVVVGFRSDSTWNSQKLILLIYFALVIYWWMIVDI